MQAVKTRRQTTADTTQPPKNGELLLSYWKRIGGTFDGGFLEEARRAAEYHGFTFDGARLYQSRQLAIKL